MKRLNLLLIFLILVATAACKKSESENTATTATDTAATSTYSTTTSATDTTNTANTTSTTGTMATSTAAPLSGKDKDFVESAAKGGMAEVALAQDAILHATDPDVKAFAQKLVDDHTKANQELTQLGSSRGVKMPGENDATMQKAKERLMKLTGKNFDQAFVKQMVEDHKSTIKLFEDESKAGADQDLKSFADKTLPTLQEHLKTAEGLQSKSGKK